MQNDYITIKGAKEHNLKNIDLKIPRNNFIVITGLSGSGKSSLAFDTIYAEGQRRYVESLSAYARQFLEQLQKPNVESIEGLSPTISIEQKTTSRNPRSTVGTQTEINDYLRLLFARVGVPYDPITGKPLEKQSAQEIVNQLLKNSLESQILVLAPLIRGRKGEYRTIGAEIAKAGFSRFRADGKVYEVDQKPKFDKFKIHNIDVVIDRLTIKAEGKKRLTDSVETALKIGKGTVIISFSNNQPEKTFSEHYASSLENFNLDEISPRLFSFNSPYGACPQCKGLGTKMEIDPQLLVPDDGKPWINAIVPVKRGRRHYLMYYRAVLKELSRLYNINIQTPLKNLSKSFKKIAFYGSNDTVWGKKFEGVIPYLERMFNDTQSDWLKEELSQLMSEQPCPSCQGKRLRPESLCIKINDVNIADVSKLSIKEANHFFSSLELTNERKIISEPILKEIVRRLNFCINVGLDYLTLDRMSGTLSGGEAERIRLATQVGSGLVNVIYILDEPSIGLHQRDNDRLLNTLHALKNMGNTLIVVEHDEDTIRKSDYIIDIGPGAGEYGGEVIYAGKTAGIYKSKKSLTGLYLSGRKKIPTPKHRRAIDVQKRIQIIGAKEHNLKNIDVNIPLGTFSCITGVSGSGKSTLVHEILYKALQQKLYKTKTRPGAHESIKGFDKIDKLIEIDQSPIGRTPRSNPATYTNVFSYIRDLFSRLPESKIRGYGPGRFSFNVKGGRCEACQGDGIRKIEMHFLPDVYVTCDVCNGKRFNDQTLEVYFKDKNISDVLNLSVSESLKVFENIPRILNILKTLDEVGLSYIRLGQQATTLSGGEAQRVKLATELCKRSTGQTFYILDEPTTGLHFADVEKLLSVLQQLVDKGNTVLIIEHNLEVIKNADYVIDLGPEGGDKGGHIVATGTPEEISKIKSSFTGQYLKNIL